ncbi:outer membrane beta-barrel family protein [Mucilaginibacter aquariorum]|uniref:TonB-dependent receptor family protein n=1 Tax=Mucilaginibacter aquariorum TaxID=2967225 RepID=A0ABT1T0R3_9SPHI|nr:outer membrane beta-barrel family protein [Mucilaginibacter aquariorum]MCQ6958187.1 TonB-dependent receptor family protein [Mucilaginibacter aquariorum]
MKRILLLIIVICASISAKAQFGVGGGGSGIVGKISGTVVDSLTKKPVDYATISLFKSGAKTPINGVLTDEKGNFKLDNVRAGKYKITISFIGYPTKTFDPIETTASKPDNNMGQLVIAPSAKTLKEVQVVGQQALIENKIDKIVYNAEKDLTAAGGNATDVLQKVPLVSVDMNGNVAIRGDGNVRVLINGKPSGATSASLSDVLKTIPADQIKSIEVVTSPSAKYDAEGSAGIINIITKTKNASGISGSVSGGVGTRQNNGNMNLNYNKNRFNFSANLGGNLTWPQTMTTDFDQTINSGAVNQRNHNNTASETKRHGARGTLTAGYEFNGFNSINSTLALNDGGFNTNGGGNYSIENFANPAKSIEYFGNSASKNKFSGFDWNLDYTHKFKKEGHEITVSGQWSHSIIKTDYLSLFQAKPLTGKAAPQPSQKGINNGKNNEYTIQADYTLPISKTLKLEAGGKTIQRRINSDYTIYSVDSVGNNAIVDPLNSNLYNYNQNVYAGYSVFTITLPKNYSVLAGFRYENTQITGDPETPYASSDNQQELKPFTASYNTYVPSLTIQKVFGSNTFKLSYSKRIQRPSLQVLNPFINRTNIQSQSVGNPNLAPEVSQTVELNYNTFIKSSVLNFSVYYKRTNDLIEGIAEPISEIVDGETVIGTRTIQNNVALNNSWGASFFGSVNPIKPLTIRGSVNAFTYNPTVYDMYVGSVNEDALKTRLQYTMFGSAQYTFPKNFIFEAFGFINSPRRTIQGSSPSFGIYAFGVKKQFLDKKASIGFNTVQPFAVNKAFNQNISSPGFTQRSHTQFPFQSFGITFSYSFGKINFSNPQQKKKKGVNNDDQIQGGDQNGGGAAPTGGR